MNEPVIQYTTDKGFPYTEAGSTQLPTIQLKSKCDACGHGLLFTGKNNEQYCPNRNCPDNEHPFPTLPEQPTQPKSCPKCGKESDGMPFHTCARIQITKPFNIKKRCLHSKREEIGQTSEGLGTVLLYWCPDCGALKRTMTNWEYRNYSWQIPKMRKRVNNPKL